MADYTTIDDPSAHFQTALYTGDGNDDKAITNDGNSDLKPDLVWLKDRTQAESPAIFDSSRGATERIQPNSDGAESTETATLKSFTTDGFTVGTSGSVNNGSNPDKYAAWQWVANGGTTASDSNGSITSTVQANQDAGFSIVQYTGTGTAATIGHGLGVAPAVYIVKNLDQSGTNWTVFHKDLTSNAYSLYLNDASAESNSVGYWNGTSPTSTVFSIKNTSGDVNTNTEDYIAYCFADVQGYSKFGKYTGNGSSNGPMCYCGFKPAFILVKSTGARNWLMYDNKRGAINLNDEYFYANSNAGESTSTTAGYDFLSNGFKVRNTYNDGNVSSETYTFAAFADNPFVTSTGIPATARALTG